MIEGKVYYFEKPGQDNTEDVFRIARARAEELGINTIVVASTRGVTAVRAVEFFAGRRVIAVGHITGYRELDAQVFTEENRQKVEAGGGAVLTTTEVFAGGVDRAMRNKFNMSLVADTIAGTLRVLGQGVKVVCEICMMAADAGLVRTDEDVIAIGGTGRGADTAAVLTPVNSTRFFDLRIKEILCKPLLAQRPAAPPAGHHH
ncbi:MAG: pyruvate kinase alpha/beta domain-containing protein [Dehalococcoidales bacterium]|nr:pyruvate kinase alpha/beta domain-containing protein [Dehalococcoidales bacterium]